MAFIFTTVFLQLGLGKGKELIPCYTMQLLANPEIKQTFLIMFFSCIYFFVGYLMTLSVAKIYSIKWMGDGQMIN
jgi:hypothetical protein